MPVAGDTLSFGAPLPAGLDARERLRLQGFCVLGAQQLATLAGYDPADCPPAFALWNDLPADGYLKDGGHYRFRRHGSFVQTLPTPHHPGGLQQVPHRAHWQPTAYKGTGSWRDTLVLTYRAGGFLQP